jgi:FkbH-like protein
MTNARRVTLAEVHKAISEPHVTALPKIQVAVLRNVMVEPIEPYFRYCALQSGFNAEVCFGGYDLIVQESAGTLPGPISSDTDVVLLIMRLEGVSWRLARQFPSLDTESREREIKQVEQLVASVVAGIRRQTRALIVWWAFEQPVRPAFGAADAQMAEGQRSAITRLNEAVRVRLAEQQHAYMLDINACIARVGVSAFLDLRYWHVGRAPYSREALRELAGEAWNFVRAAKGKQKKCLVLDCDNTLWGGIVGEDGIAGIKIGGGYPGSAYQEFQQEILNLYHRGVILALCSKNNEQDVWEVFRQHPDMILKEANVASARINWEDKATNLRQIAQELNIGLDSMVFVDDNEVEIELVHRTLPEIVTLHLPDDKVADYRDMLASLGVFDTLTISDEDRQRGVMYRAEASRKRLQEQALDMSTFLASLEMKAEVRAADALSIPRIAQLTQKTNQFNLTTKRYSDSEIASLTGAIDSEVLSLRIKDRFGDSGLVGVAILKHQSDGTHIDTFLLSCRVLGRMVEDWFLRHILHHVRRQRRQIVWGTYFPTSKNIQTEAFYEKQGFVAVRRSEEGRRTFSFSLEEPIPPLPSHITSSSEG